MGLGLLLLWLRSKALDGSRDRFFDVQEQHAKWIAKAVVQFFKWAGVIMLLLGIGGLLSLGKLD